MGNNRYFKEALSDFAFDAAYGDSIRHLYDRGYTPDQIREYLNAESLTVNRIQEVIDRYTGAGSKAGDNESDNTNRISINNYSNYELVKEYDPYGRSSFVMKKKES